MTLYEQEKQKAIDNDKIVYYDYISYKRTIGWKDEPGFNIWYKPKETKRALYNGTFIKNLPNYYFFGIPIKEFIKAFTSNGRCHTCILALSLCFKDFSIINCNLENYTDYLKENGRKIEKFEHSILIFNDDKKIIDTTFGIITDYETYNNVFEMTDIKKITSKELKNTDIYKYIESKKDVYWNLKEKKSEGNSNFKKFVSWFYEYRNMLKEYKNSLSPFLENYLNRYLYSNFSDDDLLGIHHFLKNQLENGIKIEYPNVDLFSLKDDEFDYILEDYFSTSNDKIKCLK